MPAGLSGSRPRPKSAKSITGVKCIAPKKNRANAYFLEPSAKERAAQESSRAAEAIAAFELVQERFHARSNLEKNAALYVDLLGEEFKAPAERITARMVARIGKLNERFLFMAAHKVELLQKYERKPEKYVEQAAVLKAAMEKIRAENPKNPGKAVQAFLDGLLGKVGK